MAEDLLAAGAAGSVRVAIGRSSDYYGPRGLLSAMGARIFYPALAGKRTRVLGDPDQPHTYSYVPDIARGLAVLGEHSEADGEVWHLPNPPTATTREFIEQIFEVVEHEPGISSLPSAAVSLVGLFNKDVRELKEMLYEFEDPYVVNSEKFVTTFGDLATPRLESIQTTVEWFRTHPQS